MNIKFSELKEFFGRQLQENVKLSNYTTSRVGGIVAGLLPVNTQDELISAAQKLWEMQVPFKVIGSGANILVSDKGFQGIIILNRVHNVKIHSNDNPPSVFAESGAVFGNIARQSALRGLSGLEWATSIPGTVGGAIYGNAGAHGSDISTSLILATILQPNNGIKQVSVIDMEYSYRNSLLKRERSQAVILSALFKVSQSTREQAWEKIKTFNEHRKQTQPPGASMGSTFKNPPGDFAGRLIEACGLKGKKQGNVMISPIHANFFVNLGNANASDYLYLINLAQKKVKEKFGIMLELEIELIGDF